MKGYNKLRAKAMDILKSKLPETLYYHDVSHTLDVLRVCNQYIKREKIDPYSAKLLRLGALLHDIGFTVSNKNHEERGAKIAKELMSRHGFSKSDIATVDGLIIATRIPQRPKNKLEEIICDADLDYLGRDDFFVISNNLYRELRSNSILNNREDWHEFQLRFLEAHSFHTGFARKNRQPKKEKHMRLLKAT